MICKYLQDLASPVLPVHQNPQEALLQANHLHPTNPEESLGKFAETAPVLPGFDESDPSRGQARAACETLEDFHKVRAQGFKSSGFRFIGPLNKALGCFHNF